MDEPMKKQKMKQRRVCLAVAAAGLIFATLSGATDSVQAAKHKHVYVARYPAGAHSHTAHKICYATRYHTPTHAPRKVCRSVGGYSRLTAREVLWGPAGMPPAPKDFGPHFDFPPEPLNGGLLHDPYPN